VDALVGAGAIQPLVGTLQYGAFDLKREAAMALWQLCKDGRHLGSAVRKTNALFASLSRFKNCHLSRQARD
jgi:hypothetical protein